MIPDHIDVILVPRGSQAPRRSDVGYVLAPLPRAAAPLAHQMLSLQFGPPRCHDELQVYQGSDGHRVDLHVGEDDTEIMGRVDTCSEHGRFCQWLCELATSLACQLFIPVAGLLIAPDPAELNLILKRAEAAIDASAECARSGRQRD